MIMQTTDITIHFNCPSCDEREAYQLPGSLSKGFKDGEIFFVTCNFCKRLSKLYEQGYLAAGLLFAQLEKFKPDKDHIWSDYRI